VNKENRYRSLISLREGKISEGNHYMRELLFKLAGRKNRCMKFGIGDSQKGSLNQIIGEKDISERNC